jgi:hypothetical protein
MQNTAGQMISEKRKYTRISTEDDVYAALGTHFKKVGKMIDISICGLAFRYIYKFEDCAQYNSSVTIFSSENELYLPDIACRLIYDSPIQSNNSTPYLNIPFRVNRCGLQFATLTDYQLDKLEFFINNYT